MDNVPLLREILQKYNLLPHKKLGQHFLLDENITAKIVKHVKDIAHSTVIEIGPGPGGLTRSLLNAGAKKIIAIEIDPRCWEALSELQSYHKSRLEIIQADALKLETSTLGTSPRVIVANLPYNVATPLLIKWLPQIGAYKSLTLMFQKEVADRLAASPRTSAYGRLSVMTQRQANVRLLFDLPPQAFYPPPKVTSTVIQLSPRKDMLTDSEWHSLEDITRAAFSQRRKMLKSSLKGLLGDDTETILRHVKINPQARAEELSVEEFCNLATFFRDKFMDSK